jgi:hypothetical protein
MTIAIHVANDTAYGEPPAGNVVLDLPCVNSILVLTFPEAKSPESTEAI